MGTTIRAKISKNNKWWISRHRYYELKHFCMQYADWVMELEDLDSLPESEASLSAPDKTNRVNDPVGKCAERREDINKRVEMIEECAELTDSELGYYILIGVTRGISYDILRLNYNIPCCKNVYYDLYRKFFWILDKKRG